MLGCVWACTSFTAQVDPATPDAEAAPDARTPVTADSGPASGEAGTGCPTTELDFESGYPPPWQVVQVGTSTFATAQGRDGRSGEARSPSIAIGSTRAQVSRPINASGNGCPLTIAFDVSIDALPSTGSVVLFAVRGTGDGRLELQARGGFFYLNVADNIQAQVMFAKSVWQTVSFTIENVGGQAKITFEAEGGARTIVDGPTVRGFGTGVTVFFGTDVFAPTSESAIVRFDRIRTSW